MRTTLDIENDVLRAVTELATLHRKATGQVVSELLRKALQPATQHQRIRSGVPLLTHRAGAPPTTMAIVNELRDDD